MVNSMKIKMILLCLIISSSIYCQSLNKNISNVEKVTAIDSGDSVVFDLSQINLSTSPLEVPVSIISDDTIYALDFSLKYDHNALEYDTIMDLTSYLMALSYYNTNDSTIRFTSSSFQPCDLLTPLALVRFNLLTPTFSNADLYSLKAYLNGNLCSIKVILPTILSVTNLPQSDFNLFPNPAVDYTTIETKSRFEYFLYNQQGILVKSTFTYNQDGATVLNVTSLENGVYFVRVKNEKGTSTKKIFVCH